MHDEPRGNEANSLPRRLRLSVEDAWKEASKLAETVLDTLLLPTGGFSSLAVAWLTTCFFFALSLVVGVVLGFGGLVLFAGLECLALLAYAYPGALFLLSVAGGLAPPLVVYWMLHTLAGVEGDWTTWGAYPLVFVGLFGAYYYWRFSRVIAATGESALAFYRGAAPKAAEIFGAPFAILSALWAILRRVLGLFRSVASELFSLTSKKARSFMRGDAPDQDSEPPKP